MTTGFRRGSLIVLCGLALIASCASGQWLNYPVPGIPRLPDGKPNLAAPAPKAADGKPDLSGVWMISQGPYGGNIANDLKPGDVLPWADALAKQREENLGSDSPLIHCLPAGPRFTAEATNPQKIVQTPALVVILNQNLTYRQIFLDGRELPADPSPDFMGYSVGHWEADTLVVTTVGYNDRTWLDGAGHPHTESLRTTERFRRKDFGHLEITETFDDPKAYARPWTVKVTGELTPDSDLLEYVCNENEKDVPHLVGKASDVKGVEVARELLAKYAGAYAGILPNARPIRFEIYPSGGQLLFSRNGSAKQPLTPISNTKFMALGVQLEFLEENGEIVATQFIGAAGEVRLPRVREER
ncbi:MAG TPA: hypothetical protein VH639_06300 [Bryobacteraceae bacterium]|jgi:hypothetical protein